MIGRHLPFHSNFVCIPIVLATSFALPDNKFHHHHAFYIYLVLKNYVIIGSKLGFIIRPTDYIHGYIKQFYLLK